jgi:hypothetical protein
MEGGSDGAGLGSLTGEHARVNLREFLAKAPDTSDGPGQMRKIDDDLSGSLVLRSPPRQDWRGSAGGIPSRYWDEQVSVLVPDVAG